MILFFQKYLYINDYSREEESFCKNVWTAIVMVDNWKKGILYILFAAPCFIQPTTVSKVVLSRKGFCLCDIAPPGLSKFTDTIFPFFKDIEV